MKLVREKIGAGNFGSALAPTHLAEFPKGFWSKKSRFDGAEVVDLRFKSPFGIGGRSLILLASYTVAEDEPSPEIATTCSWAKTATDRTKMSSNCLCITN